MPKPIAISLGEPAGIGPDIVLSASLQPWQRQLVVFGCKQTLANRARQLDVQVELIDWQDQRDAQKPGQLYVHDVPLQRNVTPGELNPQSSAQVIAALQAATDACLKQECAALVTAPIHKANINQGGIAFLGHTEFLREYCNVMKTIMTFDCLDYRIALQTTHLPLRDVASQITKDNLVATIKHLHQAFSTLYNIENPHIAVCGLNPHAGEDGILGDDEINEIEPALNECREQGITLSGPYPADTILLHHFDSKPDIILSMYHDQLLPALKAQHFSSAVNITLGLPIIRTSVDHGSAIKLAGTGRADSKNICHAIEMAIKLST